MVSGSESVCDRWDLGLIPLAQELATASGQQGAARPQTRWCPLSGRPPAANAPSSSVAQRRGLALARAVICQARCPPPPLRLQRIVASPVRCLATSAANPSGRCRDGLLFLQARAQEPPRELWIDKTLYQPTAMLSHITRVTTTVGRRYLAL